MIKDVPVTDLVPGDVIWEGYGRDTEVTVLRPREDYTETVGPLAGRPGIRYWAQRADTRAVGYMPYGPGAAVNLVRMIPRDDYSRSVWGPDADGVLFGEDDHTLGDDALPGEWSVRIVRTDRPTAFIQVTGAAALNRVGRYAPEIQLEYLIGKNPDGLADTEEWSGNGYDNDHLYDYETAEGALCAAERIVKSYAACAGSGLFEWDGITHEYPS